MLSDYGQVGFLLAVAIAFPLFAILTSLLLARLRIRVDKPNHVKEDTYE